MNNYRININLLDKDDHDPVGYKKITCHLIFDAKMDLTRKSRYMAVGNLTDHTSYMTYTSMFNHYSVQLAFLIAALNDLYVLAGDTHNEYQNASTKEKVFSYAGDEC